MKNSLTMFGAATIIALGLYFGLRERSAPPPPDHRAIVQEVAEQGRPPAPGEQPLVQNTTKVGSSGVSAPPAAPATSEATPNPIPTTLFDPNVRPVAGSQSRKSQKQEASYKGPAVDQIRGDLDGQKVVFTKPWAFFKVKDQRTLVKDELADVKPVSSTRKGDTLTVRVEFKFVGMVIAENKQWLKATGILTYRAEAPRYRFLKFVSTSAGEPLAQAQ